MIDNINCHGSLTSSLEQAQLLPSEKFYFTSQPLRQLKLGSPTRYNTTTSNTTTFFKNLRIKLNSVMSAPSKTVFKPDTCDTPSDVTIIVEDGKKFEAHRHILADASPFFERLLSNDMRESKEGVVRLQMLTESALGDILEFIYTGCVQISDEDRAYDLIAMADYLFLPQLKSLAGDVLTRDINCSNCVSRCNFGETYQCEELIAATKNFIFANFSTLAKTDEFLHMPSNEVEMWISSDEINVSAEEDVFEFILSWIDHNKVDRKKYFFTLFRHIRVVYVSRDYFRTNIVTNKLVMCDTDCLDHLNKSENKRGCFLKPRKSLQVPVIFIRGQETQNNKSLCYFPREDACCTAPDRIPSCWCIPPFTCHDQIYFQTPTDSVGNFNLLSYDTFSNTSTSLSLKHLDYVSQLLVTSQNEIYALVGERFGDFQRISPSSIMKHDHKSNSWKHESSFDWTPRYKICIINKDDVIYFLGGKVRCPLSTPLADAYRYDISAKKFQKITEMKQTRSGAHGAALHGKIFVIGGKGRFFHDFGTRYFLRTTCEVYNETTDEWQMIAGLKVPNGFSLTRVVGMLSVDDKLFVLGNYFQYFHPSISHRRTRGIGTLANILPLTTIECYDPDKNEWNKKTEFPNRPICEACSMRVFKGSEFVRKISSPLKCHNPSQSENKNQKTFPDTQNKKKCLVM